ncbi:MAG: GNAT family N-acetyltransferase [Flavobacteriaceae bacterium]|nr:GNAT family N-acetyltransferase [Flavobacteriaceae bacterium]
MHILRTDSSHQDFIDLVGLLDADLAVRDGDDHAFYDQFNSIENLKQALVLYHNNTAVGCGAMKPFEVDRIEIKRMYTLPNHRGKGYATKILAELESWARELGYTKCVLETGMRQPEAIQLYIKNGYERIPNYGQYKNIDNSLCFEKAI